MAHDHDSFLEYVLVSLLPSSLADFKVALIVLKLIEDILTASESIGWNWLQVLIKAPMPDSIGHSMVMVTHRS